MDECVQNGRMRHKMEIPPSLEIFLLKFRIEIIILMRDTEFRWKTLILSNLRATERRPPQRPDRRSLKIKERVECHTESSNDAIRDELFFETNDTIDGGRSISCRIRPFLYNSPILKICSNGILTLLN